MKASKKISIMLKKKCGPIQPEGEVINRKRTPPFFKPKSKKRKRLPSGGGEEVPTWRINTIRERERENNRERIKGERDRKNVWCLFVLGVCTAKKKEAKDRERGSKSLIEEKRGIGRRKPIEFNRGQPNGGGKVRWGKGGENCKRETIVHLFSLTPEGVVLADGKGGNRENREKNTRKTDEERGGLDINMRKKLNN